MSAGVARAGRQRGDRGANLGFPDETHHFDPEAARDERARDRAVAGGGPTLRLPHAARRQEDPPVFRCVAKHAHVRPLGDGRRAEVDQVGARFAVAKPLDLVAREHLGQARVHRGQEA